MTAKFEPFADDAASTTVSGITVENGRDRIVLYGNLEIGRTPEDLRRVRDLTALLEGIARGIEASPHDAPSRSDEAPVEVKNPFS